MGIYQNGKKIEGMYISGKKVAGIYLGGKKIFSSFLPPNTVLAAPGLGYTNISASSGTWGSSSMQDTSKLLKNKTLTLSKPISKTANGIVINISKVVNFVKLGSQNEFVNIGQQLDPHSSIFANHSIQIDSPHAKITKKQLDSGNFILFTKGYGVTPTTRTERDLYIKKIDDTTIQFKSVFPNTKEEVLNSTQIGWDNASSVTAWAVIDSVTTY